MPVEERSRLFAVAGPPGGVGKSVLAANLAVVLTRLGAEVTLADLDRGGARRILDLPEPEWGVFHFLYENMPLHEAVRDTDVPGLRFLGGGGDVLGGVDLNQNQKRRLIDHLMNLRGDAVVIDLGSGGTYHNLDLLAMADEALLMTAPEVAAQMKAYGFLKMCLYRAIIAALRRAGHERAAELAEEARLPENARGLDTTRKLIEVLEAEAEPGSADEVRETTARFGPRVVVNMVDDPAERKVFDALADLAQQNLALTLSLSGVLPRDPLVKGSAVRGRPYVLARPGAPWSLCVLDLARRLWAEDRPEAQAGG